MRFQDKEDNTIYIYKRKEIIIGTNKMLKRLVDDNLLSICITPKGRWCYDYCDGLYRDYSSLKELMEEEQLTKDEVESLRRCERIYQIGYTNYTYWGQWSSCDSWAVFPSEAIDMFEDFVEDDEDFVTCVGTDKELDEWDELDIRNHRKRLNFAKKVLRRYLDEKESKGG